MADHTKQTILTALSKRLSFDPKNLSGDIEKSDLKSLCTNILKSSSNNNSSILSNDEAMKWIAFADSFPLDSEASAGAINSLNDELVQRSVLVGNGFKLSEIDLIVYLAIHPCMIAMSKSAREKFLNVLRWMDYVQSKEDLKDIAERIPVEKARFIPQVSKSVAVEANLNVKGTVKDAKADTNAKDDSAKGSKASGTEAAKSIQNNTAVKKAKNNKEAAGVEQKKPETEAAAKDDVPVSLLNIQVGLIRKAWKHPSADSLLVEEIDVGESKVRQVVSGLAKYCSPDDLANRRVALITNVKPGKLRDVVSEGLVLCASSEDHSVVEPLLPPEAAQVGERVCFSGHEGKPEDVLNPKKKQLEKITPHLFTDENGVATYKGIPFMTSGGPCTSSIRKGSIK
ncbi:uncharacterized protein LOC141598637 isoform X1 [Silene latifolia]|uniref:uncharacterized protein LOC141598637 isoform X1 n=1 Tax=Silene latifolia TaxID=37657 RepID=UPI003D76B09F